MLSVLSDVSQYPNNLRTFNSKATYQEEDDHDALHKNHSKNLTPRFLEKLDELEETNSNEEADGHIKNKRKDRELCKQRSKETKENEVVGFIQKLRRSIRVLSYELSK